MNKKVFKNVIRKKKFILTVSALVFTWLVFSGCAATPKSQEKIELNGMIYDTQNRPVVNYDIYIDGKYECTSDIGGRFLIKNIKKGEHDFYGTGAGYLNIQEKISVRDKLQIIYLRVSSVETKFSEAYEFLKEGELNKAEECAQEVLECYEDNIDALYFMCVINYLKGKKEEADNYFLKIKNKEGSGRYEKELEKIIYN